MKITLAFTIFNKEKWIESLLESWIVNLSGRNEYEIVMIFDACYDKSEEIAKKYLDKTGIKYKFYRADDRFEVYCNNLALKHSTGDYIVFIQDDNWIYDKDWDLLLTNLIDTHPDLGAIGLLAGLRFERSPVDRILQGLGVYKLFGINPIIKYTRIEFKSKHKGNNFQRIKENLFLPGICHVDAVIRPFAVSIPALKNMGGLDKTFMPMDGDDMDLSIKLLKKGKKNILVPFDVLNTTAKHETLGDDTIRDNYMRAMKILSGRYFSFLIKRESSAKRITDFNTKNPSVSVKIKFTLIFTVFNKEKWIKSLMESWISNLSGKNEYEIIIVFDACKDRSEAIVAKYLEKVGIPYKFYYADDKFEIYCNNLGLKHSTGDHVIFIQDDNWIYDKNWDLILANVIRKTPDIGAIGLLSGIRIKARKNIWERLFPVQENIIYERVEVDRLHKGKYFSDRLKDKYESGIWQVDAINRPFCVSRKLLVSKGGLNKKFMPTCGDDLDLSIKFLEDGRTNIYIPFDLLNITASNKTLSSKFITDTYTNAYALNYKLHKKFLTAKHITAVRKIMPFK